MTVNNLPRRRFLQTTGLAAASMLVPQDFSASASPEKRNTPNIIVIFCDDLGYGDLSVFGHPTIHTPNLDRMAREGQKWTNFYAAASVCTPSRAAIMTGRYPIRSGMCSDERRVLFPDSAGGLPESEVTVAEALKTRGYATGCIGKWHLGHLPQYLPTRHGFDSYFGIPYSNDMDHVSGKGREGVVNPKTEYFNVPLMRDEEIIERPADQNTITKRYTEEALKFIRANRDKPFFLYLAHNLPHVPLFASKEFLNTSLRGIYGDVVEEIDHGVGQIIDLLYEENLAGNTLVLFTSDNGPWLSYNEHGGSAGLLREGKGTTYEGGMREPTIFWWPGRIKPGVVAELGSTMDLFATACRLSGAEIPGDRVIDGVDLRPVLFGTGPSPRETLFYYRGESIYAARKGPYKAHFITELCYVKDSQKTHHDPPLLYNLLHDPSEKYNIAEDHPDVIQEIMQAVEKHKATVVPVEDQLAKRLKKE